MTRLRVRPVRMGAAAIVLAVVAVLCSATTAQATPNNISFDPQNQTVEYGQDWFIQGNTGGLPCNPHCQDMSLIATVDGVTKNLGTQRWFNESVTVTDGDFHPPKDFGVGTHTISLVLSYGSIVYAKSTVPAKVTITATTMTSTTTIVADPNNGENAIVTSQLSGTFIDSLPNCYCEGAGSYPLPAGTWNLNIVNSAGKTVFSKQVPQKAGGEPYNVNYWQNVPPGQNLTAQSSYAIGGATGTGFKMTVRKFDWTSNPPTDGHAVAPSHPATSKPSNSSSAPPVLVYVAALAVTVILIALDLVLFLRRRRRRAARTAPSVLAEGAT